MYTYGLITICWCLLGNAIIKTRILDPSLVKTNIFLVTILQPIFFRVSVAPGIYIYIYVCMNILKVSNFIQWFHLYSFISRWIFIYIYICILLMVNSRKLHWIDRSIEFDRYIYGLCKWGKRNPEATSYFEPTSPDSPGTCSSSEADLVSWRRQRWQSMRIVGIVHTRLNVSIIIIIYTSMRTTHA